MDAATTVSRVCGKYGNDRTRLMDILREIQHHFGCISGESMELVASKLKCSRVEVEGLVTFYAFFSRNKKGKVVIRLCDDIIDRNAGIAQICDVFARELDVKIGGTSADGNFSLEYTPCIGMSDQAPAALVNEVVLTNLTVEFALEVARSLKKGMAPSALVVKKGDGNNSTPLINSMVNNNIRRKGEVLLADGIAAEAGLQSSLRKTPQEVIREITDSGLKGRGGAGFQTGDKLRLAAKAPADKRYVICNADEGEPGTFKDRVLLTERADLVFEGMTIAAYAIGSDSGIMYLRAEYAYLLPFLDAVIEKRRKNGLLGKNILGKDGFNFDVRIQMGAGAYICGEESALISSCEGLRGEPKNRPPFPVERGYLGKPTTVNNVETLCCVARIMDRGATWFAGIGTAASKGTKLLSVCGDCRQPGIYELPFGIELSEILKMAGAEDAAIAQVGGAGGTMIGRTGFGRKICFSDLATGGALMVFGPHRNVLGLVEYFLEFFTHESCGYCTPCRVGVPFMRERIQGIMRGFAEASDLEYLKGLAKTIKMTSRCGLGTSSVNSVLNSMENFPLVYSSHLQEHKDGLESSFDIQKALDESRRLAKRSSMIYDPVYGEGAEHE